MQPQVESKIMLTNALVRYGHQVRGALADLAGTATPGPDFSPGFDLPPASDALTGFFGASDIEIAELVSYKGRTLRLLNLMLNPRTRTTKTFASLVIVARAIAFIQRTNEPVMIVSPSSGNKATALRDAVLRAYETGLATPEQLGIVAVIPAASHGKLWSSPLSTDELLRTRNPVVSFDGAQRADVKPLARSLIDGYTEQMLERYGIHLWYTLDIDNYKVADVVRACAEQEFLPPSSNRLHVHAVSSAYGLLGHDLGARRLAPEGTEPTSRYFLVQHLDTPDMVLSLYFDSTSRENLPPYAFDGDSGLYHQHNDPRFPTTTFDPAENLDSTFYTRQPVTSADINPIINARGGGGIVVSLHECLERYPKLRMMLGQAGVALPADPRNLREWSLVMAMTGILNAIDRDLVDGDDILVHGTGTYQDADYAPIPTPHLSLVEDTLGLAAVAATAAEVKFD